MGEHQKRQWWLQVTMIVAFICYNARPVLAEVALLPNAHVTVVEQPRTLSASGSIPTQGLRSFAQAVQPETQQSPGFNPFAILLDKPKALLDKPKVSISLNSDQLAIIEKVNAYLSGTRILSGNFTQVGPDGNRTSGDFFISKPGKVRFEYSDPNPIELIADGQSLVVRDRSLATQDIYPLSQTPLRFLLSNHVDLLKDTNLVTVSADNNFITIVAEENNNLVGTSRLAIMFRAKDMQLKQWTVTDPQGYDTTVAVYNLDTNKKPDSSFFKIDYTNYHN
jgi:outer membrane lipoprotein-sorting protein